MPFDLLRITSRQVDLWGARLAGSKDKVAIRVIYNISLLKRIIHDGDDDDTRPAAARNATARMRLTPINHNGRATSGSGPMTLLHLH